MQCVFSSGPAPYTPHSFILSTAMGAGAENESRKCPIATPGYHAYYSSDNAEPLRYLERMAGPLGQSNPFQMPSVPPKVQNRKDVRQVTLEMADMN